jgi:hypothetical protein
MSDLRETREETEARLIVAHQQRTRETVRTCSDAEYAVLQSDMLKAARVTAMGKPVQADTSSVRDLSEADYQKREREMLRNSRRR